MSPTRPPIPAGVVLRQGGAVLGSVVIMAGAGLPWLLGRRHISPFHLNLKWLAAKAGTDADPVKSIGMLLLLLVGIILFGLVTSGRSVTIGGGIAAIVVAFAFAFSVARSGRPVMDTVGLGAYLTVLGGGIAVIGTLLGSRRHRHRVR